MKASRRSSSRWAVTALAVLASGASLASAGSYEVNTGLGLTLGGTPLALRGFDPVSYFEGGPELGSAEHAIAHAGATYRFASAANLAKFQADPDRFLPQYGGFCAFGVSVGAKFDGDPLLWRIVDDRLYLNLNAAVQKNWSKATAKRISQANENWPKIRDVAPSSLKAQ